MVVAAAILALASPGLLAQDPAQPPKLATPQDMVLEGNRQLMAGVPQEALDLYRQAGEQAPDAREIAFGKGLAHYELGAYADARSAFQEVLGLGHDVLSDDANYSLGTCDHAEALAQIESNPQATVGLLESALDRYQQVLEQRPDHAFAREARMKAASLRRLIKEQLEQQQQESSQDSDNEDKEEENSRDDQQQSPQDQEQDSKQQQDQSESPSGEDKDKETESQPKKMDEQQQSREQAQRKLREMMQAMKQRQKQRKQPVQTLRFAPVEKDW